MKVCHACKRELSLGREVGRRRECPHCGADLHSCLNCSFYDRTAPKQCREPAAELVRAKERSNFCDYFAFLESRVEGNRDSDIERSRKALDDLFKK